MWFINLYYNSPLWVSNKFFKNYIFQLIQISTIEAVFMFIHVAVFTCFYSLFVFSLTLGTAFVSHSKRHGWSIISMLFSSLERRQISKISQIEQFSDVCVESNFQMFVLLPLYLLWIFKFDFSLLSKVSCHLFIDSIITLNTLYIFWWLNFIYKLQMYMLQYRILKLPFPQCFF